jgi:hypothetical protein
MDKRKRLQIELSRQERKQVEELLSGGVQPVRAVIRALVLRQMDEGRTTVEAGAGVGISAKAAWEIGKRYQEGGLEAGIYDAPRPGQKPLLDAEHGQRIIAMVCGPPPAGRARWSVRLIAQEAVKRKLVEHVGPETVRILLQSHDLKPWREKNVVRGATGSGVHPAHGRRSGSL